MLDMTTTHFESLYPADTREHEISQILSYIKAGNSCQVIGLPGVGRANLLNFLSFNHAIRTKHLGDQQKQYHFVTINFSEVRKKPLAEVIKFLLITLTNSLEERRMEKEYQKAKSILKDTLSFSDELMVFSGLKKVVDLLAIEQEYKLIFLFERFETYVPMLTEDFFSHLQTLRNRAKFHFSVVFSLNRPLQDVIEPELMQDFYQSVANHIVYIPFFDKIGLDFRIAHLEKSVGKTLPEEVKKQLLTLTSEHVKLTRLSIEVLLSSNDYNGKTEQELETFLLFQNHVLSGLYEIWQYLTPSEQEFLLNPQKPLETDYLEKVGLLQNGNITIPLFKIFITRFAKAPSQKEELEEHFVLDTLTNEIKKGGEVISDKLTGAEFRLLLFLLQNKERILERDELIAAVWKDQASIAGVTDQALDQLIFRLRKKIEPNPNNPIHIETVKGRGFKFTP